MVQRTAPVALAEVAQRAISHSRAIATAREIRIELEAGPAEAIVEGDKDLLFRVVTNLLDNAYKYTPAGSCIRVEISIVATAVVLRVIDEGVGIPREQRPLVFDKYFQVDQKAPTRPSYGLGLSFCKLAIEAHRGSIEVEDLAQGCAFRVTLPVAGTADITGKKVHAVDSPLRTSEIRADSVIVLARQVADEVLKVARDKEDQKLDDAHAPALVREAVNEERAVADDVLEGERSDADDKLSGERGGR